MFERYTEDARKVIFLARYEASRLGSSTLETDHLWLGLLRQNKKVMKRLAPQVTVEAIHQRLAGKGLHAERTSMASDLPLSPEAGRALEDAATESTRVKQIYVTTEYLVLALLREEGWTAPHEADGAKLPIAAKSPTPARPPAAVKRQQ